jgi:hypothetical protein
MATTKRERRIHNQKNWMTITKYIKDLCATNGRLWCRVLPVWHWWNWGAEKREWRPNVRDSAMQCITYCLKPMTIISELDEDRKELTVALDQSLTVVYRKSPPPDNESVSTHPAARSWGKVCTELLPIQSAAIPINTQMTLMSNITFEVDRRHMPGYFWSYFAMSVQLAECWIICDFPVSITMSTLYLPMAGMLDLLSIICQYMSNESFFPATEKSIPSSTDEKSSVGQKRKRKDDQTEAAAGD